MYYWQHKTITIEREELYERVWKTPMYRLAAEYGISDVGLKKVCKKLRIPTPPRGYWVRLEHGWKIKPEPLPKLKAGDPTQYFLKQRPLEKPVEPHMPSEEAQEVIARLKDALPIRVPATLRKPHRLIAATNERLKKARPDQYGMLQAWADGCVNMKVGPNSVKRALIIMNTIVKFLESQNIEVISHENNRKKATSIKLFDETVSFGIKDRSRRHTRKPEDKKSWQSDWYFVPIGELTLFIDDGFGIGYRTQWSDAKSRKVEDALNDFIVELVVAADSKRQATQKRLDCRRRADESRRRMAEIQRQAEAEADRLKHLEQLADRWTQSAHLKNFITAAEQHVASMALSEAERRQFEMWVWWANKHVEKLNPLSDGMLRFIKG